MIRFRSCTDINNCIEQYSMALICTEKGVKDIALYNWRCIRCTTGQSLPSAEDRRHKLNPSISIQNKLSYRHYSVAMSRPKRRYNCTISCDQRLATTMISTSYHLLSA